MNRRSLIARMEMKGTNCGWKMYIVEYIICRMYWIMLTYIVGYYEHIHQRRTRAHSYIHTTTTIHSVTTKVKYDGKCVHVYLAVCKRVLQELWKTSEFTTIHFVVMWSLLGERLDDAIQIYILRIYTRLVLHKPIYYTNL